MADRAYVFKTGFGWVGIGYGEAGLRRVELSRDGLAEVERNLANIVGEGAIFERPQPGTALARLPDKLIAYFDGEKVEFDEPVDLGALTPFQGRVLENTRRIPYGETRSYAWVAEQSGNPRAYRAAGQALGVNPVLIIIPCHRVITSQGALGGFGCGLDVKKALLAIEQCGRVQFDGTKTSAKKSATLPPSHLSTPGQK